MITILSRKDLYEILKLKPNELTAVLIAETEYKINPLKNLIPLCKECYDVHFDDTIFNKPNGPKKQHIENILNWTKDKTEDIIVSCLAGVSRSSAVAYLIECQRSNPIEAIKIFDIHKHIPNERIIYYGSEILGKEVIKPIKDYYDQIGHYPCAI